MPTERRRVLGHPCAACGGWVCCHPTQQSTHSPPLLPLLQSVLRTTTALATSACPASAAQTGLPATTRAPAAAPPPTPPSTSALRGLMAAAAVGGRDAAGQLPTRRPDGACMHRRWLARRRVHGLALGVACADVELMPLHADCADGYDKQGSGDCSGACIQSLLLAPDAEEWAPGGLPLPPCISPRLAVVHHVSV